MTISGWVLVALGLLGMLIGLGMGTSAPGASVVNLSLMQQQTVTLTLSGFLFLAGCILIVGGSIVRAIDAVAGAAKVSDEPLRVGSLVRHADVDLGIGEVKSIDGDDAVVRFASGEEVSVGVGFLRMTKAR